MAEENDAQENDAEAEMLRMMQEELGGEDSEEDAEVAPDAGGNGGGAAAPAADPMAALAALETDPGAATNLGEEAEGLGSLTDVEVEITVELGDNLVPIADIMSWASGSIVELQEEEQAPVRVLLNGSPFARGEIVVVGDTFGVRIVELLDPQEHH